MERNPSKLHVTVSGIELTVDGIYIKDVPKGRLFYCQDRLAITDENNVIQESLDVINFITLSV